MSWKANLNLINRGLASVGEKMVTTSRAGAQVVVSNAAARDGLKTAARIASDSPVRELAQMCSRAGVAGAVVDGVTGGVAAVKAMRKGQIDGRQAVIHTTAEAGCGFVTSSAGTAGTLAAYMVTGTMGPLAIAAGMGASVGSRYVFRAVVGETLPADSRSEVSEDP